MTVSMEVDESWPGEAVGRSGWVRQSSHYVVRRSMCQRRSERGRPLARTDAKGSCERYRYAPLTVADVEPARQY